MREREREIRCVKLCCSFGGRRVCILRWKLKIKFWISYKM